MWRRAVVPVSVTACCTSQPCLNPRKWMERCSVYRWLLALLCCNFCGLTRWLFGINLLICILHLTLHLLVFFRVSVGTGSVGTQQYHSLHTYSRHNIQYPLFVNCCIKYTVQVISDLPYIIVGGVQWMDRARPRAKGKLKFMDLLRARLGLSSRW
jgi:hypothetical protein